MCAKMYTFISKEKKLDVTHLKTLFIVPFIVLCSYIQNMKYFFLSVVTSFCGMMFLCYRT